MAHLLETSAPQESIGLCQIGSIDFDRVAPLLKLEESHILVHSLLGGRLPERSGAEAAPAGGDEEARVERALEGIGELSSEEVDSLLRANREAGQVGAGDDRA